MSAGAYQYWCGLPAVSHVTMEKLHLHIHLVLLTLHHVTGGVPRLCPHGWREHAGSCYKHFLELQAWHQAEDTCRAEQVRLSL